MIAAGLQDLEFIEALESCRLPADAFDHRQHVRLAWLYLREQPLLDALPRFITSLKRYAGNLGAGTKYHETITFAFLFLIHERMARHTCDSFEEFESANADLFGPILQRYYRNETLASEFARATFVMPDRAFA